MPRSSFASRSLPLPLLVFFLFTLLLSLEACSLLGRETEGLEGGLVARLQIEGLQQRVEISSLTPLSYRPCEDRCQGRRPPLPGRGSAPTGGAIEAQDATVGRPGGPRPLLG